jgi:hypothetical protein
MDNLRARRLLFFRLPITMAAPRPISSTPYHPIFHLGKTGERVAHACLLLSSRYLASLPFNWFRVPGLLPITQKHEYHVQRNTGT